MRKLAQKMWLLLVRNKKERKKWKRIFLLQKEKNKNNNEIIIIDADGKRKNVFFVEGIDFNFTGRNSKIEIDASCRFSYVSIDVGDNSFVKIGRNSSIHNLQVTRMNNARLEIGDGFSCSGCRICLHDEAHNFVTIGQDCMFSYDIVIWPSDGHTLFDINTNEVLNRPKRGIKIGNHVWLGRHSSILKNVDIADNVMVGACSVVNKDIEESNVVVAGTPAKIVKSNVNWRRENTDYFETGFVA
ncbi:uncharacterized protein BN682_01448 [Proteobacteria bacterium CAG:495]|jgi:transferase, hexapeptide repeat family|nr:uncharacterized protein BN682_01448 [Proteobacteria bacterium CAG:495]